MPGARRLANGVAAIRSDVSNYFEHVQVQRWAEFFSHSPVLHGRLMKGRAIRQLEHGSVRHPSRCHVDSDGAAGRRTAARRQMDRRVAA